MVDGPDSVALGTQKGHRVDSMPLVDSAMGAFFFRARSERLRLDTVQDESSRERGTGPKETVGRQSAR